MPFVRDGKSRIEYQLVHKHWTRAANTCEYRLTEFLGVMLAR